MKFFSLIKHYLTGTYNLLLAVLFLLFVFRPFESSPIYPIFWKFLLIGAILVAIYNDHHKKGVKIAATLFAVPSVAFTWLFLSTNVRIFEVFTIFFTSLFLLICTCSMIYDVLLRARVTIETLKGVICAYFLIAFLFAYLFVLIEFHEPGSFKINGETATHLQVFPYFAKMLYFSFVTLLTIGYGDIVAVKELGQSAGVIEGIIGQFYVAILVTRIVSVYCLESQRELLRGIQKEP